MCDSGNVSLGLSAIGGLSSAAGAYGEAAMTQMNYRHNAAVSRFNAQLAERRAEDAMELGRIAEQDVARGARQAKGSQVASMASSGIALSSENALNILAGTDVLAARDVDTIRENTRKQVFAEEIAAQDARTSAQFADIEARGSDPGMAATSSLINSTSQVASRWYDMKRARDGG